MSNFGGRIKSVRVGEGLTQQQFAKLIGFSRSRWSEVEKGNGNPNFPTLCAILNQYPEMDARWLMVGTGESGMDGSAGGVRVIKSAGDEASQLGLTQAFLKSQNLNGQYLSQFVAPDDAMEPYLSAGDVAVVDTSQTDIRTGQSYWVRVAGEDLLRRLSLLPNGEVQVAAENVRFGAYQVPKDGGQLTVVGRIVSSLNQWR